ncbi:MAG: imidazolonepropionase [Gammaproteobacteria bacterium]|nr:imidazolonepropionase [Gammaproteobacteria bacterium]
MPQTLFMNARLATLSGDSGYALIDDAALLVGDDKIEWLGSTEEARSIAGAERVDCTGRLITPGLIDCHTHLVYGGDRADEFELRLEGASYQEIAQQGGGILSTVHATRAATEAELLVQAIPRIEQLLAEGVTTIEIKSGYGLDRDNEIKMLRVAQRLGKIYPLRVQKTFLGAHALPPEFEGRADDYIKEVCESMLPAAQAQGLVDAVDIFIESIGFSVAQAERVFDVATRLGLPLKAHVEQLSDQGGAVMAAGRSALSVDHIEYLQANDVAHLAANNTVAVLLPGAFYVLRETQLPPIEALRRHQIPMAIATDANPGSSPVNSLLLILNMACTLFRLTPAEALRGVTINAAKALGLDKQTGSLEVGKQADLVIWDIDRPSQLAYQIGINSCAGVMQAGNWRKPLATGAAT